MVTGKWVNYMDSLVRRRGKRKESLLQLDQKRNQMVGRAGFEPATFEANKLHAYWILGVSETS